MSETPAHGWADDAHRYRLDSRIATGGMGEVWRATDTTLGRSVAVKLLKAEYADDATFRSRFETEARHAASLHHPGVAGVYDFGEAASTDGSTAGKPYLVMELVEGQPLSALLADARRSGRDVDASVVQDLVAQAGEALGAAHTAGIVHRDVKPANLMVTPEGTVKITDFGIARAADGVQMTQTGAVMGTPQYLSPEQARGDRATAASDVYALGVVAFECLAGRRPFEADSPVATALAHLRDPVPDLPDRVPADLAAVVRRSLSKDPAERYPDGRAFAVAVRRPAGAAAAAAAGAAAVSADDGRTQVFAATSSTPAQPPTPPEPVALAPEPGREPEEEEKKSKTTAVIAVLAVLLVIALVAGAFVLLGGDDSEDAPTGDRTRRNRDAPSSSATTSSPPPSTPTTSDAPTTVEVDPNDYVGSPIDVVQQNLESKDLVVSPNEIANDGTHDEGEVASLAPSGSVEVGSTITVDYYGAPPETSDPPESPDDTGDDFTPPGQGGTPPGQGGDPPGQGRPETGGTPAAPGPAAPGEAP